MSAASESTSETTETETDSTEESGSGGGKRTEGMQKALTAEREKRQALEQRLAEFEAAQQKAAEEAAAKRGEFEQLYTASKTELEKAQARLAEFEARETARTEALTKANAEALEQLPETMRALVPEGLDPEAKAAQIRKLAALVTDEMPRGGFAARKTLKNKSDAIPAEYRDQATREAQQYSMDPQSYWTRRLRPKLKRQGKLQG